MGLHEEMYTVNPQWGHDMCIRKILHFSFIHIFDVWVFLHTKLLSATSTRCPVIQFSSDTNWSLCRSHRLRSYSYKTAAAAKSLQSCSTLCDPRDGSPPGSPVPGILQARTLEWGAIAFSNKWITPSN